MRDFSDARRHMVESQLARRGIRDARVLDAMGRVPREAFVPPDAEEQAYDDAPLSIGDGQTISQPYIVALMIAAAEVKAGDRVLEIGGGSGYAAAVLSLIGGRIHVIERHASLAGAARERFARLGYRNIALRHADGTKGWPDAAPFDAILVSAGSPAPPPALKAQLAIGGRLIAPVGERQESQTLLKITRRDAETFDKENLGSVMFVPLIGEQGWSEEDAGATDLHSRG